MQLSPQTILAIAGMAVTLAGHVIIRWRSPEEVAKTIGETYAMLAQGLTAEVSRLTTRVVAAETAARAAADAENRCLRRLDEMADLLERRGQGPHIRPDGPERRKT